MAFNSESDFEAHLRDLIGTHVVPIVPGIHILGAKKGVDLCVVRDAPCAAIFFIEAKYFNRGKNHSMVALGSGSGSGFQPEVLATRPHYLENHLRWVLGTAESDFYFLLTTAQACTHLSGKQVGEKQNGFNRSVFKKELGLTRDQFVLEISQWFRSA